MDNRLARRYHPPHRERESRAVRTARPRRAIMVDMAPKGLNHLAYLTWDTAATVQFYEEVLGFPLVYTIVEDKIPSAGITGQPFLHTFFDMGQGELLAFIE